MLRRSSSERADETSSFASGEVESATSVRSSRDEKAYEELLEVVTSGSRSITSRLAAGARDLQMLKVRRQISVGWPGGGASANGLSPSLVISMTR